MNLIVLDRYASLVVWFLRDTSPSGAVSYARRQRQLYHYSTNCNSSLLSPIQTSNYSESPADESYHYPTNDKNCSKISSSAVEVHWPCSAAGIFACQGSL